MELTEKQAFELANLHNNVINLDREILEHLVVEQRKVLFESENVLLSQQVTIEELRTMLMIAINRIERAEKND
jgi:hypothetical protein